MRRLRCPWGSVRSRRARRQPGFVELLARLPCTRLRPGPRNDSNQHVPCGCSRFFVGSPFATQSASRSNLIQLFVSRLRGRAIPYICESKKASRTLCDSLGQCDQAMAASKAQTVAHSYWKSLSLNLFRSGMSMTPPSLSAFALVSADLPDDNGFATNTQTSTIKINFKIWSQRNAFFNVAGRHFRWRKKSKHQH